ncbi:MAG: hypothetical protein GY934_09070, partial [Gammaproteobacteria bacterium]|nr:hypothetical protein [Gammaproteobacteria bacterium]
KEWAAATSTFPYSGRTVFYPDGMQHYAIDITQVATDLGISPGSIESFSLTFDGYSSWNSSDTILIRFDNVGLFDLATPLSAPDNMVVSLVNSEPTVSWDAVGGATTYNVYWSTAPGVTVQNGTKLSDVTRPFAHTGIASGETYYYIVTAENNGGESGSSLEASVVVPLQAPTNISIAIASGDPVISWDTVIGATAYNLYWSSTPGVTALTGTKISDITSPFTHAGLTPGEIYYYIVTAVKSSVESGESAEVSVTLPPPAPAGFSATLAGGDAAISWGSVTSASSYNLYWSTTPGVTAQTGTKISGAVSPYTHTGLVSGESYYYVVTAVNSGGESSESIEDSVTIPPAAPVGVRAAGGSSVTGVWWDDQTGADSYNLYWSASPGVTTLNGTLIGNVSSPYRHSGLTNGNTYYYIVTAVNSSGESSPSSEVSAAAAIFSPFNEDFESGLGSWAASNGVWEAGGPPAAGPLACYGGSVQCAGTILDGSYPDYVDSHLVSPSIQLPALGTGEELQLRFWHWFLLNGNDAIAVQIQEETSPGVWSAWSELMRYTLNSGGVWTRPLIDLSAYAGKKIRLGFLIDNHGSFGGVATGWYLDDVQVSIVTGLPLALPYNDDFETGLDGWSSSNGVWEVGGPPVVGPLACNGGSAQCAGTILDGNYPDYVDSHLVSPSIQLPVLAVSEQLQLRFWHWFLLNGNDAIAVQIQEETSPGVWSAWSELMRYTLNSGGVWTRP